MGIREALAALRSSPATEAHAAVATVIPPNIANRPTWSTWDPALAARDNYQKLALIFRCINLIAHAAGTATVRVYDEARDNESIADHPLRVLMTRPNPQMGESVFHGTVAMRAAISGFCAIEKERDPATGEVIALWPLISSYLKALPRRNRAPDWEYRIPGIPDPFPLRADDVIIFRWADTATGSPYGAGPLEACAREVGLLTEMTDFLKVFFEGGAVPLLGIIPDLMPGQTLSQKKVDLLLEEFLQRHGGLQRAAIPAILQGVKDIKRLGFDFNELAYSDLRDLSELGIVQAFGIPATVAQIRVGLQHSDSRANAESDEGKFYRQAIVPFWSRWDDTLTLGLLPDFEDPGSRINLEFDWSKVPAMQEDRNAKAQWLNGAVAGGWLSVHAWHREMGLPLPEGDDYYMRGLMSMAIPAADPLGELVAPVPTPALSPGDDQDEAQTSRTRPLTHGSTTKGLGYRGRLAAAPQDRRLIVRVANARTPSIRQFFRDQYARIIDDVMRGIDAEGLRLTVEALSALEDQGKNPIGGARGRVMLALSSVDWDAENRRLRTVVEKVHLAAGSASFGQMKRAYGVDPGIAFDLANPKVRAVTDRLGKKIVDITAGTRGHIADLVTKGLRDGIGREAIADSIKHLFVETYKNRAQTIARTESTNAYGAASQLGFKESGVVDRAQIFDNPDHDEDYGAPDGLTCAERDGIVVDIDDAMDHIEADHPNGSAVMTPVLIGEDVDE